MGDFDTYYGQNPWEVVDKNQREWYFPQVSFLYQRNAVLSRFVPWTFNLRNVGARYAHITQLLPPQPSANPLGMRQMWVDASHIDSREVTITFQHYGGKMAFTEFDELITYWKQNKRSGLRRIIEQAIGMQMVESIDVIARNAFVDGAIRSGYTLYANPTSDDGFLKLQGNADDHRFHLNSVLDIWLGMNERGVTNAIGNNGAVGSVFCVTTPGIIYDIQKEIMTGPANDEWIAVQNYAHPEQIVSRYEVGQYKGVRFIQSPRLILRNAGHVAVRGNVTAPFRAGDGAPDPGTEMVDGAWRVGQSGATHYLTIQLTGSAAWNTDVKVGDIVTIHFATTQEYTPGEDGVDWRDSRNHDLRIVKIEVDANDNTIAKVAFDKPLMVDGTVEVASGIYAYMTLGDDIHSSLFIGQQDGIVGAVSRAPLVHHPRPVDDFEGMYRVSWDGFFGMNLYNPGAFEVVLSRGSTRPKGEVRA